MEELKELRNREGRVIPGNILLHLGPPGAEIGGSWGKVWGFPGPADKCVSQTDARLKTKS